MSHYRRSNTTGASYFFTVVSYRRQGFLCLPPVREALRAGIIAAQVKHPFEINAWVLLPDHVHTVWTLPEGDANFSVRWQTIKRMVSHQCKDLLHKPEYMTSSKIKHGENTLWQRRYWEHQIRSDKDFENHVDYIHYNPVKHRLVERVEDWPYSTFHKHVKRGVYPADWGSAFQAVDAQYGESE
jgi:putative transposase